MMDTARAALRRREPQCWLNTARTGVPGPGAQPDGVASAEARWQRFAPLLAERFPELRESAGRIESPLIASASLAAALGAPGRLFVKADHALPVAGSIKARGAIHEVLEAVEAIASRAGLLAPDDDLRRLLEPATQRRLGAYRVSVGSTGNLGLGVGIGAAALGLRAEVHMSAEAKAWKKALLRERGAVVVEHAGDYSEAVAAGRTAAALDPNTHFVDDEHSLSLFNGYATAAARLHRQLDAAGVRVDAAHPLIVYLPCGVGGAPGGISYGLHLAFGAAAHAFFAEPVGSPAFLARLLHPDRPGLSVYDLGLDNATEADGLAVPRASELAYRVVAPLLAGAFTVTDEQLLRDFALAHRVGGLRIEPSAAAGFSGPRWLGSAAGRAWMRRLGFAPHDVTQVVWTTGGLLLPQHELDALLARVPATVLPSNA